MEFINAVVWLVMIVCFFMTAMRFWGMMGLTSLELHYQGDKYTYSIVRFLLGGIVALLWIIFG